MDFFLKLSQMHFGRRKALFALALFTAVTLNGAQCGGGQAQESSVEFPTGEGLLNVRDFGAKGDGRTDDTQAFQNAFAAIKKHYDMVYVPNGTYLVSDTFGWRNFAILRGQSQAKTIIKLKDNCPGYGSSNDAKPVIRCVYNNNESIGNYISYLTLDTGRGNPKAIGIRYNAHNQGILEHVTIRSGDGTGYVGLDLSETEFGPAFIRYVTVRGFDVGIRTPGTPSHATMEYITLQNQRLVGIENNFPLSCRKLTSYNAVPAIRNSGHWMAQLVLLDSQLNGGGSGVCAIDNSGALYARNVSASGYKAALQEKGQMVPGAVINEYFGGGTILQIAGAPKSHLKLPIEDPPKIFSEPVANWVTVDASEGDVTQALQAAIDSGAQTIYFKAHTGYKIKDTIRIRGNVKRIFSVREAQIQADINDFGLDKPLIRIEGDSNEPVSLEYVVVSTWPNTCLGFEIATKRPVYLKSVWAPHGFKVRNTKNATGGKLFLDEWIASELRLDYPQNVWIRHCDTENNPFNKDKPIPTYIINRGGNLWILGMKTEAPAINVETTNGGRTEILGGFFRDHFNPSEYGKQVPYFIVKDSSLSASYLQYAWESGKARGLQAILTANGNKQEVRIPEDSATMNLLDFVS